MANITKRTNKAGEVSYRFRVYIGESLDGKQLFQSMTWTPPSTMRPTTAEKEARRQAHLFEEDVRKKRVSMDGKTRFADYAADVLATLECTTNTKEHYEYLLRRINEEIGHLPLVDIGQEHLRRFYKKLRSEGQRNNVATATATGFREARLALNLTQEQVSVLSSVGVRTIAHADKGQRISFVSAQALSNAVGKKVIDIFTIDKGSSTLSAATVWHHHKLIRMILEVARSERVIPYNEAADMKNAPTKPAPEVPHLDDIQAQEFIVALANEQDIRIKTALMLAIYTALRRGELCGLSWSDVDLSAKTIRVNKASQYVSGQGVVETKTKTKSSERIIQLQTDLLPALTEYRRWWTTQKLKYGADWHGKDNRLFIQDDGKPIFPSTLYRWLQGFLKRNELPQVSLHSLRHTCLTLLLSTGADVKQVQQISGHSTAATLLDTYGHFLQSSQEPLMDALSDILTKKLKKV